MHFFGLDGGSTKTDLLIADHEGHVRAHVLSTGLNYSVLGYEGFKAHAQKLVSEALGQAGLKPTDIACATFGIPAYGEIEETEVTIPEILGGIFPADRLRIVNDGVVGWSGSLSGMPGINVVAGTGSIAYGMDPKDNEARAGGWSTEHADEGSCSWIGIRAMAMFFKQSDGRLPRTVLYELFKERFALTKKDIYFLDNFGDLFTRDKSQYAKLQLLAYKAYQLGDPTMQPLYDRAAWELSELVRALIERLDFGADEPVPVSYSGGLFKTGDVILKPFRRHLSALNVRICRPEYPPNVGAVAYSARSFLSAAALRAMLANMRGAAQ